MARQRLKQDNLHTLLRPNRDDLFIAGETPRFDGQKLRIVLMRVALDGYAEMAVDDIACLPRTFWHWSDHLPPERIAEVRTALAAAQAELKGLKIDSDPNDHIRLIDCWAGRHRAELKMPIVAGVPQHPAPAFEAAWAAIVALFPKPPVEFPKPADESPSAG